MTRYRTIARFSIQAATVVFLVVFILVVYHRLMPMNMPMDVSMPAASSCETICLLGASLNWQQTAEGAYALRVMELGMAALLSVLVITLWLKFSSVDGAQDKLIKLGLYYKYRWRLPWTSYWSDIYQQGIIPPRLYA